MVAGAGTTGGKMGTNGGMAGEVTKGGPVETAAMGGPREEMRLELTDSSISFLIFCTICGSSSTCFSKSSTGMPSIPNISISPLSLPSMALGTL